MEFRLLLIFQLKPNFSNMRSLSCPPENNLYSCVALIISSDIYNTSLVMTKASNRSNSPSKEHRCSICGRTFDSIETLDSHKAMEHSQNSQAPAGVG